MHAPETTAQRGTGPRPVPGRPGTAAQARDLARDFLHALSPQPTPETTDTVLLVVSELVTNALRHAGGITSLKLYAGKGTVDVVVRDPSATPPHERPADLKGASGGFGWPLVRHLAAEVAVNLAPPGGGKSIRATLAR
ncbi:ATP-binding protein [Streptomyces sp. NPDC054796]